MADVPLVTLCIWRGHAGPPPAFDRDAEDAERRLHDYLVQFYTEEADERPERPRARARSELRGYMDLGLVCYCAPSEAAAFALWFEDSALQPAEALRRFRAVFPAAEDPDPLLETAWTLSPRRAPRLPADTTARLSVIGRFADKLTRYSAPKVEDLKSAFEQKTE